MKSVLKAIDALEDIGCYRMADYMQNSLVKFAAFPYNLTSLDELPLNARFYTWKNNEQDFEEFDDKFWDEFKQRLPDYRSLNVSPDEAKNLEGEMHGPDPTSGPAYVDPGNPASSPSMSGGLDYFTWENAHDANQGPEYWKNLTPRR